MRQRLCVGVVSLLAITLLGTAKPGVLNAPLIIAYPLTTYGDARAEAGPRIVRLIAEKASEQGDIAVHLGSSDVKRADFLAKAREAAADYYFSGYVTGLDGQLSAVEQLVSASSGTIVWSNTALLATEEDAQVQGDLMRRAALAHSRRAFTAFTGTPIISSPDNSHRKRAVAKPTAPPLSQSPAPVPLAEVSPARTTAIAVLEFDGNSENAREYAARAVVAQLNARGLDAGESSELSSQLPVLGPTLCETTGAKVLIGGSVSIATEKDHAFGPWSTARVDLTGYDCTNKRDLVVASQTVGGYEWQWAIDRATASGLARYALRTSSLH